MTNLPVGIKAIAVSFPSGVRTNDYWKENYPQMVQEAEQKNLAKLFSASGSTPSNEFSKAMMPYLKDPFRGSIERRVLGSGESSLTLEYRAAKEAIEAAKLSPNQLDLMLVASIFPEEIAPGNAAFLAHKLGFLGAAWNVESTCSSALVALQSAYAMVQAGLYRNVLVVVSNTYTRFADEKDTFSWFLGDGAGAVVVSQLKANQGILGTKILNTGNTCGAFFNEFTVDEQSNVRMWIRAGKDAGQALSNSSEFIRTCCQGAVSAAGLTLDQIHFFAFNTPTAWYADVCANVLNIEPQRIINLNPKYANIGAAFPFVNLYHAAESGRIRENDLVVVYTLGTSSSAGAMVMRWGEVALGPVPASSQSQIKVALTTGV